MVSPRGVKAAASGLDLGVITLGKVCFSDLMGADMVKAAVAEEFLRIRIQALVELRPRFRKSVVGALNSKKLITIHDEKH